jgi:hypothetical protein
MSYEVILVMDGWINPLLPDAERNPLLDNELCDEVATANPDTGSTILATINIDEDDMNDIRNLAKKGIRPMFYLVEVK